MRLFGRNKVWQPPEDMKNAQRELDEVLRRVSAELNVRRNYNTHSHGQRYRDRMADSKSLRILNNPGESKKGDTS